MKQFMLLLVIAAAVGGGWWWFKRGGAPVPGAEHGPVLPGPDGVVPGGIPGPQAGNPVLPGPGGMPTAGVPGVAKADYDAAEALWLAAGADPAQSTKAPEIARLYSKVLIACYGSDAGEAFGDSLVKDRLTTLGEALFFSTKRYEDALFVLHQVQPGDVPDKIAGIFGTTYQQINRLRGRQPEDGSLRGGETLKVLNLKAVGGCLIHADKSAFRADVFVGGVFARRHAISIGAVETPTPLGRTEVTNVVFNPPWRDPISGKEYPPGDPGNILGGVWIALSPDGLGGVTGIGLHGYTGEDRTLEKMASNGCLRFENEQVKQLAWLISRPGRSKTVVEIVE